MVAVCFPVHALLVGRAKTVVLLNMNPHIQWARIAVAEMLERVMRTVAAEYQRRAAELLRSKP